MIPALAIAFLAGTVVGLALVARHGARSRKLGVPFAPFMALGGLTALLVGQQLIDLFRHSAHPLKPGAQPVDTENAGSPMALTLSKKNPRGSVGLDLDGGFVAAVQAVERAHLARGQRRAADGVITDGEVTDIAGLSTSLKSFFKDNSLPTRVRLGVSNQQIVVRHLELPLIQDQTELAAAVRFQAAEAIAMPLEEAVLDFQVLGQVQGREGSHASAWSSSPPARR